MLSFPPLLDHSKWKGASANREPFPGSELTWKKALAPRPLARMPNEGTVRDLQAATAGRFDLLQQTIRLPEEVLQASAIPSTGGVSSSVRPAARSMPLYDHVWPGTTAPTFSVWEYTKKHGHAMGGIGGPRQGGAADAVPAPRVTDMKSWFNTYGHPSAQPPTGSRSEFTSLGKSVPYSDPKQPEASRVVRMYKGSVLR